MGKIFQNSLPVTVILTLYPEWSPGDAITDCIGRLQVIDFVSHSYYDNVCHEFHDWMQTIQPTQAFIDPQCQSLSEFALKNKCLHMRSKSLRGQMSISLVLFAIQQALQALDDL